MQPLRNHTGIRRAVLAGCLLLLPIALAGCGGKSTSYSYDWQQYFLTPLFSPDEQIINGLWLTLSIAVAAQIFGVVLGIFAALMKMSGVLPLRLIANLYIWFFRGTPLLVQIMILYYGLLVTGIYGWQNFVVPALFISISGEVQAGIFALGVNEGAYMAEIVRAGILSIDPGQTEAAKSLGMTYGQTMRRIVLPQAARVIVPPLGNEFNNMLKSTSLLIVLGAVFELYFVFSQKNTSFHPFELFLACALWYLLLTTIWSFIQGWIEGRLAKGFAGQQSRPSLRSRLFGGGRDQPIEVLGGH